MRTAPVLASLALLGLLNLLAPPGLAVAEGRFVAVMTDGSSVALSGPPERRGAIYVGKLVPTGQFVSFPVEDLDARKTEEANRPPKPTPTPKAEPILGHSSFPTRDAGRVAGSGKPRTRGGTLTVADGWPARSSPPSAGTSTEEPADRHGRKEAWWRRKAEPILSRIATLEAEVKLRAAQKEEFERSVAVGTKAGSLRAQKLRKEEATAQQKLQIERRKLERLAEEARKAGAYPGWIR